LIPAEVFANQVVATGTVAASFSMGVFIGLTIYTPIYFQSAYHLSASQSGLALIPLSVGTVIGAVFSSRLMPKIAKYKRPPIIGLSLAAVCLIVVAIWPSGLPLIALEIVLTAASAGIGTVLSVTTVAVQNAVMPHQMGTATGGMSFFRSLGGAIAVAGFGAILMSGLPANKAAAVTMDTLASTLAAGGENISMVFRGVFVAAAVGALLALCSICVMKELPLRTRVGPTSAVLE
jgi:MFS family permease